MVNYVQSVGRSCSFLLFMWKGLGWYICLELLMLGLRKKVMGEGGLSYSNFEMMMFIMVLIYLKKKKKSHMVTKHRFKSNQSPNKLIKSSLIKLSHIEIKGPKLWISWVQVIASSSQQVEIERVRSKTKIQILNPHSQIKKKKP